MFKHNFKIARRNLVRNKAYSILNISGLAIGMASSILIFLWVQNESSYDQFHTNANQLYRLVCNAGDFKAAVSPAGMPEGLQSEMPEIISTVRLSKPGSVLFEVADNKFDERHVFYADSNFLELFSFPLIEGDPHNALNRPDGVLITEATALKYFGTEQAMWKIIKKDNQDNFIVTGILASIPTNSHLQFDIILPMSHLAKTDQDLITKTWSNFNFYSYLLFDANVVSPSTNTDLIKKIAQLQQSHNDDIKIDFQLQPLTDIHLHSDLQIDLAGHGNVQYVNIFFVVAFFILIVACINFMNLATARSSRRAKEVGLRKVVGARRNQLIFQFLSESLIISFLSMLIAVVGVYLLLPAFNSIAEKELTLNLLDGRLMISLLAIAALTGLLSGSYPALFLSGFKPIKVLQGKLKLTAGGNQLFRNGLVAIQFVVSILMLVGATAVYNQLNFIKDKNLGFEKSNLLYVPMSGEMWRKQNALRTALEEYPQTSDFSIISDVPTNIEQGDVEVEWEGKDPNSLIVIPSMRVDNDFIEVFQIEILEGRGFSKSFASDSSNYLINETAVQIMGMELGSAVGKSIVFKGRRGAIIGVVKDFNYKPLQYSIEPLILQQSMFGAVTVIRVPPNSTEKAIDYLEQVYGEMNPAHPLVYGFIDQDLNNQYRGEQKMGTIFNLFAILAIFISCLGLYGLSTFVVEQHNKEIGIRKVLGAGVIGLINLLSKDFLRLVVIAFVIATPLSYYFVNRWLQDFAYRTEISWWIFALAGIGVVVVTLITVSRQVIKAATMNPVNALRSE